MRYRDPEAQARRLLREHRAAFPETAEFWMTQLELHEAVAKMVRSYDARYCDANDVARDIIELIRPIDTSDIPEAGEDWFKRAKLTNPEVAKAAYQDPENPATIHKGRYRPYAFKPWHGNSYGPHVLAWVQMLAYDVRDQFGRPEAVRLIRLFGDADMLAVVQPKRYEVLSRALRYKLTGKDPGPATLSKSKSDDPGIFESEIND